MSDAARGSTPQSPSKSSDDDPPSRDTPSRPRSGGLFGLFGALLGGVRRDNDIKESIEDILQEEDDQASLSPKERAMLRNLLKFGGLKVSDLMIPRADIVGIEASSDLKAVLGVFAEAQHSRLPIYRESLDEPLGMIHLKDIIPSVVAGADAPFDLLGMKRDMQFVTPSMPAIDLLLKMQATRSHLALVIDEYGGTDGLISIEDLVEQIVGEIDDEHDTDEEPYLELRADGGFDADGRVAIEDVAKAAGVHLTIDGEEPEMDTIGGFIAAIAGRVPQTGEIVRHSSGLEFEVADADPRRVKRIRVRRVEDAPVDVAAAPGSGAG